jgi:hypothetical protein
MEFWQTSSKGWVCFARQGALPLTLFDIKLSVYGILVLIIRCFCAAPKNWRQESTLQLMNNTETEHAPSDVMFAPDNASLNFFLGNSSRISRINLAQTSDS